MNFPGSPRDVGSDSTGGGAPGPDSAGPGARTTMTDDDTTMTEQLFRECRGTLAGYFAHRRHPGAAIDDLVQETFLRVLRGLDRLRAAASPRAYLFGIARHVSCDAWRRAPPTAEGTVPGDEAVAPQPDPRIACAREVIAGLPSLQREVLDLRFQHDLSYAEIADALGIPVGTVRSRLHHALRMLREELEEET